MGKLKTINCVNCGQELKFWITVDFDEVDSSSVVEAIVSDDFSDLYTVMYIKEDTLNVKCDCNNPELPDLFKDELFERFKVNYIKNLKNDE
jgi:hypothetical protein